MGPWFLLERQGRYTWVLVVTVHSRLEPFYSGRTSVKGKRMYSSPTRCETFHVVHTTEVLSSYHHSGLARCMCKVPLLHQDNRLTICMTKRVSVGTTLGCPYWQFVKQVLLTLHNHMTAFADQESCGRMTV